MIRKLSASAFLLLMSFLMLFQHPALGFCTCREEFFFANCTCSCSIGEEADCHCCPDHKEAPVEKPCDKCSEKLTLEVDDHLWSSPTEPAAPEMVVETTTYEVFQVALSSRTRPCVASRAPPDPLPIYLRHSVFRL